MCCRGVYSVLNMLFFLSSVMGQEPKPFLKNFKTKKVEYGATISPDEKTVYFVKTDSFYIVTPKRIYQSEFLNGTWSEPKIAPFSIHDSDSSPFISVDGKELFFTSKRPIDGVDSKSSNVWKVQLKGPKKGKTTLVSNVNSNKNEYSPSVDSNRNFYFGSYQEGGEGSGDLWCSEYSDGNYAKPINLGSNVNTPNGEWGSCISPDGKILVFENSGNSENYSYAGDLYISKKVDDTWQKPLHLSHPINSIGSDLTPKIHKDKLYFSSNREMDSNGNLLLNDVNLYSLKLSTLINQITE